VLTDRSLVIVALRKSAEILSREEGALFAPEWSDQYEKWQMRDAMRCLAEGSAFVPVQCLGSTLAQIAELLEG